MEWMSWFIGFHSKGYYGNHVGGRSLAKHLRVGYYWPKLENVAENFIARCDKCQRYANNMHLAEFLNLVISQWSFMNWGMDIVVPLTRAKVKVRFLQILKDYFSKLVEAGALK